MLTSESLGAIAPALAKAQAEIEHANKGSANPHFKSKYASLVEVVDTIRPVFAKHDLFYTQGFVPHSEGVTIETRITHKSGEWIGDEGLFIPAAKKDAQGFGSAVTYGRRYALLALTGVAPDDDDDGNAASASAPKAAAKKPAAAKGAHATLVSPEQAAELTAAAIAGGVDPKLAERQAANTPADRFIVALTKLKEKASAG